MYTGHNTVLTDAGVILRQYVSVHVVTHCTTLYLSLVQYQNPKTSSTFTCHTE